MPEFLRLSPPAEALQILLSALPDGERATEILDTIHALGRVLAVDLLAPHPLPEFTRSSVDGYAVCSRDTFGASESQPSYLTLLGEVRMGDIPPFTLTPGTCVLIHTGGMLPNGADAVIMMEFTQVISEGGEQEGEREKIKGVTENLLPQKEKMNLFWKKEIEISRAVAEGENVIYLGEDVRDDQIVLTAGKQIRPEDIGGCMALGIVKLRIATKPKIGIISSGDEVIPPNQHPRPGQIRDVNSYSLAALVEGAGGKPILYGIVPDSLESMKTTATKALKECNALVITAGSSVSSRDTTAEAIATLGAPGVLIHGINIRPGKPTILAVCGGKAVIGLPGNPVSALVIARLILVPIIGKLLSVTTKPQATVHAKLTVNVPSQAGREEWVSVRLISTTPAFLPKGGWLAAPVFGKSNLIFSLATADGMVYIPPDVTGISAGEMVEVVLM